ncbi:MAG TPA: FliH/SctL family protein [Pseudolabrys sp.]|nr:FliH/SctL family protein [Pseudolabrys sp.]
MTATAKYLFDEDFSTGQKPTITLVEAERRRADAESQAYRNGFSAGLAQTQNDGAQRTAVALGVIADAMDRVNKGLLGIEARLETEAVQVSIAVAGKLAPELIAREPLAEISALATDCFSQLVKAPHVVVHVGAEIYEAAKAKLDEIAGAHGFEGRLVVMSDSAIAAGDCRIEWADGGVCRDRAATLATIDELVDRYVAARDGMAK